MFSNNFKACGCVSAFVNLLKETALEIEICECGGNICSQKMSVSKLNVCTSYIKAGMSKPAREARFLSIQQRKSHPFLQASLQSPSPITHEHTLPGYCWVHERSI